MAIRAAMITGASSAQFGCAANRKSWCVPVCVGTLKLLKLHPPPELISPAKRPTSAKRVHCPKRKGRKSCCFVCSKAGLTESTADLGTQHLANAKDIALDYKIGRAHV